MSESVPAGRLKGLIVLLFLIAVVGVLGLFLFSVTESRPPTKPAANRGLSTWLAMLRLIVPKMKGSSLPSGSPRLRNDLFTNSFAET